MTIKEALNENHNFAVVGASVNPAKYGYKVFKQLLQLGYKVWPVNPRREKVQGVKSFPSLHDLPEVPDVVSVVTPPAISLSVLKEAADLGVKLVWFQPGASDDRVIALAKSLDLDIIHDQCLLLATK